MIILQVTNIVPIAFRYGTFLDANTFSTSPKKITV